MRRSSLVAAALAAAALAAPAAAQADSIVYLDRSAVWVAAPDGSARTQLTPVSSYHSVAQSDDGTIVAARTGAIDVLGRTGAVLRSIATSPTRAANGGWHKGTPVNLAISPDGRLVAYEYRDLVCPPEGGACTLQSSVMYTSTTGPLATPIAVHGQQYDRESPSFITNDRVLLMGGAGAWANIDVVGGGDSSDRSWIANTGDIAEGEFSRDGTRFAARFGYDERSALAMLVVDGDPRTGIPERPTSDDSVCGSNADKKIANPSWAPDGSGIAYQNADGIGVVRLTSFARGDCGVAGYSVLTPTGSQPDWGPADPPAPATVTPVPPGAGGGPAPAPGKPVTSAATPARPAAALAPPRIGRLVVTRAALRKGLRVPVRVSAPGRVTLRLTSGRRVLAATSRRVRTTTATVRLPRVGRRAAQRLQGRPLTLTVTTAAGTTKRTVRVG